MPSLTNYFREIYSSRLGDVATVRLGFSPLKEKREESQSDSLRRRFYPSFVRRTVLMVQPSNITDEGAIDWRRLERINVLPNQTFESHVLYAGSILLCLRGVMRVANLTKETLVHDLDATAEALPVVASSAWAVIRPNTNLLSTNYLTWQLKQPATATRLREERAGSALQFIPLSVVQDFNIPVPPRNLQDALVRAASLIDQAEQLERQRFELLRSYLAGSMRTYEWNGRAARTKNTTKRRNPTI